MLAYDEFHECKVLQPSKELTNPAHQCKMARRACELNLALMRCSHFGRGSRRVQKLSVVLWAAAAIPVVYLRGAPS